MVRGLIALFGCVQMAQLFVPVAANWELAFEEMPCTQETLGTVDIGQRCSPGTVRQALKQAFDQTEGCEWSFNYEIMLITRTLNGKKANMVLTSICESAAASIWSSSNHTKWSDIHADFTDEFMDLYTEGGTYLNGKSSARATDRA